MKTVPFLIITVFLLSGCEGTVSQAPDVILIFIDDMGWADLSCSRVAISTGTYPQRWNITSCLSHRENNRERGMANWLDHPAPMLARILNNAGYATGTITAFGAANRKPHDDGTHI